MDCPCGEEHPDHAELVAKLSPEPTVVVRSPAGAWHVPRIYIAAHGLKAADLPELARRYGFAPA